MQKDIVIKLSNSPNSTTVATAIIDISQSTEEVVASYGQLLGKNVTVMHIRYNETDSQPGEDNPVSDSEVIEQNILRMQGAGMNASTLNDLLTQINTIGYFAFSIINGTFTALQASPTLSPPASFASAVISATEIDFTWLAVPNADTYVVQMSTSSTFASGITTIYTGGLLTFHKTGLTTATHYYFRIVAQGLGYVTSGYSLTDATTS